MSQVFASVKLSELTVTISDGTVGLNSFNISLNGEIENVSEFREKLVGYPYNYKFKTTESAEVLGVLIEVYLSMGFDIETSVTLATVDLKGKFRFVVACKKIPVIVGFTRGLPLYVLKTSTENQITSTIKSYSEIYCMQDDEVVSIKFPNLISLYDAKHLKLDPKPITFQTALLKEMAKSIYN